LTDAAGWPGPPIPKEKAVLFFGGNWFYFAPDVKVKRALFPPFIIGARDEKLGRLRRRMLVGG